MSEDRDYPFALLALLLVLLAGCHFDEKSRGALMALGFTEIEFGMLAPWECGQGYTYPVKFLATNREGLRIRGVVCCGILQACAVKVQEVRS